MIKEVKVSSESPKFCNCVKECLRWVDDRKHCPADLPSDEITRLIENGMVESLRYFSYKLKGETTAFRYISIGVDDTDDWRFKWIKFQFSDITFTIDVENLTCVQGYLKGCIPPVMKIPYGYFTVSVCWMWVYNQFIYERFGLNSNYSFRFLDNLKNEIMSELVYENIKSKSNRINKEYE